MGIPVLDSLRGTATAFSLYVYQTLACLWGVESGVSIRAAIADARGMLGAGHNLPVSWEEGSCGDETFVGD
eukprot:3087193-Pyramimonas_sp.AAC.1